MLSAKQFALNKLCPAEHPNSHTTWFLSLLHLTFQPCPKLAAVCTFLASSAQYYQSTTETSRHCLPSSSVILSVFLSPTIRACWFILMNRSLVRSGDKRAHQQHQSSTYRPWYTHIFIHAFTHQTEKVSTLHILQTLPGGFIKSDLHSPAFPAAFLFTSSAWPSVLLPFL